MRHRKSSFYDGISCNGEFVYIIYIGVCKVEFMKTADPFRDAFVIVSRASLQYVYKYNLYHLAFLAN